MERNISTDDLLLTEEVRDALNFRRTVRREALVQCWVCGLAENRSYGIGRPQELLCRECGGEVEVLQDHGGAG